MFYLCKLVSLFRAIKRILHHLLLREFQQRLFCRYFHVFKFLMIQNLAEQRLSLNLAFQMKFCLKSISKDSQNLWIIQHNNVSPYKTIVVQAKNVNNLYDQASYSPNTMAYKSVCILKKFFCKKEFPRN